MKFWNFEEPTEELPVRSLKIDGPIDSYDFWGDEVTPSTFEAELNAGDGAIDVWVNSPGGDVLAASQIYTMLKNYKGKVTMKIDGLAASAASVIAMAGDKLLMSPTAMLMIHDPSTYAEGNAADLAQAIDVLNTVKDSIINAYETKSRLSRTVISHLMSSETWMDANKACDLGFADGLLFADKKEKKTTCAIDFTKYRVVDCVKDGKLNSYVQNSTTETVSDTGCSDNTPEGENTMEINNVADLQAAYPDFCNELVSAARDEAVTAERQRIHDIADATVPGFEDLAADAMYTNPTNASDYALKVVSAIRASGKKLVEDRAAETAPVNAVAQTAPAGKPKDEVDEFIDIFRAMKH